MIRGALGQLSRAVVAWGAVASLLAAASPAPEKLAGAADAGLAPPEQRWGIRPVSLRLTAGGTMVDFRYRVVDIDRARTLFDPKLKPYLLDPRTGTAMESPDASKLGPLRSSARNPPVAGKQYFVLFANGLGTFKKGDRLTVVLGDCRLENLLLD